MLEYILARILFFISILFRIDLMDSIEEKQSHNDESDECSPRNNTCKRDCSFNSFQTVFSTSNGNSSELF
jgi:hypothetical protein